MMQTTVGLLSEAKSEALILFITKNDSVSSCLPSAYKNLKKSISNATGFIGERGKKNIIPVSESRHFKKVVLYGVGSRTEVTCQSMRLAISECLKYAASYSVSSVSFYLTKNISHRITADTFADLCVESFFLSSYSFDKYKTKNGVKKTSIKRISILASSPQEKKEFQKGIKRSRIVASHVIAARDLINEPPNALVPQAFANRLIRQARAVRLPYKRFDLKQIIENKMGGLIAVSQGSSNKPAFVILHHRASRSAKNAKTICLVGKGVCFDSGGLSLKPAMSMVTMKYDMAGAATCAQAVIAAHELKIPHNVIALLPLCENSPDGKAYRPGDIVKTLSGQTVEIFNTDAEGRMILADALYYACNYKPDIVIDLATLTGAAKVCLGDKAAAILGNDEALIKKLIASGVAVGERLWQLPLWDEYQDDLKSEIADLKNIGLKGAGTITAAKFLSNFVPKTSWAHLDIAAMAWEEEGKAYTPKGASGFGLRLLVNYLSSL
jgi:leucyl aminopeptidase